MKKILPLLLIAVIFGLGLPIQVQGGSERALVSEAAGFPYETIIEELNKTAIEEHIRFFSGFPTRVTGYPGYTEASDYILQYFTSLGLVVGVHSFDVVVPYDYGANITILSTRELYPAYSFVPNLAATSSRPDGVKGPLVYVGEGSPEDFVGKPVEDSIVLMDLNSDVNWLTAAKLGAQAVVFIEPQSSTFYQYRRKTLNVPYNFPRLYVTQDIGASLRTHEGEIVEVKSDMRWVDKKGTNIYAFLEGRNPDLYFVVSAYYDSFSYVPSVAPGAEEAIGISILLELSRVLKELKTDGYEPEYTILFIAFSGHNQALEGSRQFTDWIAFKEYQQFGKKIFMWTNIDLSSETKSFGMIGTAGWGALGYSGTDRNLKPSAYIKDVLSIMRQRLKRDYDYQEIIYVENWHQYFPGIEPPLDHEPFFMANFAEKGVPSFSLVTAYANRLTWYKTPLDRMDRMQLENLWPQTEATTGIIYAFTHTPDLINLLKMKYPWVPAREPHYLSSGYSEMIGQVAIYDYGKAWYTSVPRALLFLSVPSTFLQIFDYPPKLVTLGVGVWIDRFSYGLPDWIVVRADENGKFRTVGFPRRSVSIYAFVPDEKSGGILYAPDMGKYIFSRHQIEIELTTHDLGFYTVFRAGTIVLHDAVNPYTLTPPRDYSQNVIVNKFTTHAIDDQWGSLRETDGNLGYGVAVAFVIPDQPVELLFRTTAATRYPFAALINASEQNPQGSGYKVKAGEQIVLTAHNYSRDYFYLNEYRLGRLMQEVPKAISQFHLETREILSEADAFYKNRQLDNYIVAITNAWISELKAYSNIRNMIEDAVYTAPFFAALLIPFTFLAERLFFKSSGTKRLLASIGIFVATLLTLWYFHPGFKLASDMLMVIIGFGVVILIMPVFGVIFGDFANFIREVAFRTFGPTFEKPSMLSVITISFSASVETMKKRKMRTSLTFISIILIVTALVSFTFMYTVTFLRANPIAGEPNYDGLMIKHREWAQLSVGVGEDILAWLESKYGDEAYIAPRAWLYYPFKASLIGYPIQHGALNSSATLLGLSAEEAQVREIQNLMTNGRWIQPGEDRVMVIPDFMANTLQIKSFPAQVKVAGMDFTVIGTLPDAFMLGMKDLDQEGLSPLQLGSPGIFTQHMVGESIAVIPYDFVVSLGGTPFAISMRLKDQTRTLELAKEIFDNFREVEVYVTEGRKIYSYSYGSVTSVFGWQQQLIPFVLATMVTLNIMLGSVYERRREIFIYSSVGVTPTHIMFLFLAEALVIAIVGDILGYIIAMGVSSVASGTLGVSMNFSSAWVVLALGAAALVTIGSILLPARMASKMVTPSLERVWSPATKASGNEWSIPLPFAIVGDREANGLVVFITDMLKQHVAERSENYTVRELRYDESEDKEQARKTVSMNMMLAPYESYVMQKTSIILHRKVQEDRWSITIDATRTSGVRSIWTTSHLRFVDDVRKRFLVWRSLSPEEREKYEERRIG